MEVLISSAMCSGFSKRDVGVERWFIWERQRFPLYVIQQWFSLRAGYNGYCYGTKDFEAL